MGYTEQSAAQRGEQKPDRKEVKIDANGSLGLLADGYRGILAWKKAKKAAEKKK